ncbi:hypothetical protein BC827DRAFT_1200009 [Russula dissimulans]|nr:hypothetical protein BC827DRAFT_1200009 [Russula dissimulans]
MKSWKSGLLVNSRFLAHLLAFPLVLARTSPKKLVGKKVGGSFTLQTWSGSQSYRRRCFVPVTTPNLLPKPSSASVIGKPSLAIIGELVFKLRILSPGAHVWVGIVACIRRSCGNASCERKEYDGHVDDGGAHSDGTCAVKGAAEI